MLVSTLAFAAMHACIRYLAGELHPFEIAFFRFLFGFLVLAPAFLRHGLAPWRTHRLGLHALRGGVHASQALLSFLALGLAPLATVAAVQFSAPLFATVAALAFLGERIRLRRIAALLVGFAGTWIIIRPGMGEIDTGAMVALAGSVAIALTVILIKVLARTESSLTITLYGTLFTTPFTFVAALFYWQTPTAGQLAWLVVLGILGSLAHLSLAEACKEADVTAILPLDYTRLIWASVLGYLVFAEIPDPWTWLGGSLIFGAGLCIAYREKRVRDAETPA
jgi:drug/metabolite transporter (DMT)-like permease